MNTDKIKELIEELEQDIKIREDALASLLKLLNSTNGRKMPITTSDNLVIKDEFQRIMFGSADSYVDLAVKLIEANSGRPMPVTSIVGQIRTLKGNPNIERRSVEATLYQHATKAESPRLVKMAPGIYGLRKPSEETAA
jgi:hypothetical protein